jgi:hypothetical protein
MVQNKKLSTPANLLAIIQIVILYYLVVFTGTAQAQTPSFFCDIRNETYVSANIFEFDLYITRTSILPLELACFQSAIKINTAFINGGDITPSIVTSSSEFNAHQVPLAINFVQGSNNCIKLAPRLPRTNYTAPVATNGTMVASNIGTKVCRIRLSNTLSFGSSPINYAWNYTVSPYNSIVSAFVPGTPAINTIVSSANDFAVSNNVNVFLEGLYNGSEMNKAKNEFGDGQFNGPVADLVTIQLATAPGSIVKEFSNVNLLQNGTCSIGLPASSAGSYYIVVKHRNSIETWSANPVTFSSNPISYNFTNAANKAAGDNMKDFSNGFFGIYAGDADQDGGVGVSDMVLIDNQSALFASGYLVEDIDGDGGVGVSDMTIVDNNSAAFVSVIYP